MRTILRFLLIFGAVWTFYPRHDGDVLAQRAGRWRVVEQYDYLLTRLTAPRRVIPTRRTLLNDLQFTTRGRVLSQSEWKHLGQACSRAWAGSCLANRR